MAQLFVEVAVGVAEQVAEVAEVREGGEVVDGSAWAVAPLEGDLHVLCGDSQTPLRPQLVAEDLADSDRTGGDGTSAGSEGAVELRPLILRVREPSGGEQWAVVHPPGSRLRVNGTALATGIRALSHRDELRVAGVAGRVFFSLEGLPRVVAFDGGEQGRCPRCQQAIATGTPAVHCPQCGVWHHESEAFGCWTYSSTCALCDQHTDLEGGFRWTPEEIVCHG
jgi:hypothetical protein